MNNESWLESLEPMIIEKKTNAEFKWWKSCQKQRKKFPSVFLRELKRELKIETPGMFSGTATRDTKLPSSMCPERVLEMFIENSLADGGSYCCSNLLTDAYD